ncbi:MAG: hypothetical protein FWE09_06000 [Treponema sp.]|nr:hypothetical protein [Treponema sp.]
MTAQQIASSTRLDELRKSIDSSEYIHAAIQRIAHVLSSGLIDLAHGKGSGNERQRKRRGK